MAKLLGNKKRQEDLLKKLVNDSCSMLPEDERGIHMVSMEGLVWNLFKGDYQFNCTDVKYVIDAKLNSEKVGL